MSIHDNLSNRFTRNSSDPVNIQLRQDKESRKQDGVYSQADRIEHTKLKVELLSEALKQQDQTSPEYERYKKRLAKSIEELIRAYDKAVTKQEKDKSIPPELQAILSGSSGAEQEQKLAEYLQNNQMVYLQERTNLLNDAITTIDGLSDEIALTDGKLNGKKPLLYKINLMRIEQEEASAKYSSIQSVLSNAAESTDLEKDIQTLKLAYASDRKDTIAEKLAPVEDKLHPHQCAKYSYSEDGKSREVSYTDREEYASNGALKESTFGKSSRIAKNQAIFNELNPLYQQAVNEVKQIQREIGIDDSYSTEESAESRDQFYTQFDKAIAKLNSQTTVTTTKVFYTKEAEDLEAEIAKLEAKQEKASESENQAEYDKLSTQIEPLQEQLDTILNANKQKVVSYEKKQLNADDENKLLNAFIDATIKTKTNERAEFIQQIKSRLALLSSDDAQSLVKLLGLENEGLI